MLTNEKVCSTSANNTVVRGLSTPLKKYHRLIASHRGVLKMGIIPRFEELKPGYQEYLPSADLQDIVECTWTFVRAATPFRNSLYRILPDGRVDIILAVYGKGNEIDWHNSRRLFEASRLLVVGPYSAPLEVSMADRPITFGIRFKPGRAFTLLGKKVHEIFNQTLPVEDFSWASRLLRRLSPPNRYRSQDNPIFYLENILRSAHRSGPPEDDPVAYVVDEIMAQSGQLSIEASAKMVGLSPRQFRRRFESAVGLNPKLFARIIRFQHVLSLSKTCDRKDWASLAIDAGYYDQAHMINDYKAFYGFSPTRPKTSEDF